MTPPNPRSEEPGEQPTPATPTPETPATPPTPRQPRPPLFKEPTTPASAPPPRPAPTDLPGEASATGSQPDEKAGRRPRSASRGKPSNPLAFAEPIKAGVTVATTFANEALAVDEDEREAGVYIIDEEDADGIAKPASAILSRRLREDGVLNPDLADAIAALIALASYVGKVFRRRAQFRRDRAGILDDNPQGAAA